MVRRRIIDTRTGLRAGKVAGKQAALQLDAATRSLDHALDNDCAPASP